MEFRPVLSKGHHRVSQKDSVGAGSWAIHSPNAPRRGLDSTADGDSLKVSEWGRKLAKLLGCWQSRLTETREGNQIRASPDTHPPSIFITGTVTKE